jgi:hypothetical protein
MSLGLTERKNWVGSKSVLEMSRERDTELYLSLENSLCMMNVVT